MRKSFLYSLLIFTIATTFLSSCSKNDKAYQQSTKTYSISIPAAFSSTKVVADGGRATFSTSDKIYVVNLETETIDDNYLTPSRDGATAELVGTLSGVYNVGDRLKLYYNSNELAEFDYSSQDGTLENVVDGAIAYITISSVNNGKIESDPANFQNAQSIFKLTFKNGETTLNVSSVSIISQANKIISKTSYSSPVDYGPVRVFTTTPLPTIYASFMDDQTSDIITFQVTDEDNNVYIGTKSTPASGIEISKFYTSTVNVTPRVLEWSVSDTRKILFSPGNLVKYVDGSTTSYYFEETYYPYEFSSGQFAGYAYGSENGNPTSYHIWEDVVNDGVPDNPKFFTIDSHSDWRVMTQPEAYYLIRERAMQDSGISRYYRIKDLTGASGLLIPADNATMAEVAGLVFGEEATTDIDYNAYIAKGLVFLPSAGHGKVESGVYSSWAAALSRGYYWTSSQPSHMSVNENWGCYWSFSDRYMDVGPNSARKGTVLYCVRLVREAN